MDSERLRKRARTARGDTGGADAPGRRRGAATEAEEEGATGVGACVDDRDGRPGSVRGGCP